MRTFFLLAVLLALLRPDGLIAQQAPETKTGPEIGQRIPAFEAPDQTGKQQNFQSIRGPRGAVITFFRSADW